MTRGETERRYGSFLQVGLRIGSPLRSRRGWDALFYEGEARGDREGGEVAALFGDVGAAALVDAE